MGAYTRHDPVTDLHHPGVGDSAPTGQHRGDLAGIDAYPVDLDLIVCPAEEVQQAVLLAYAVPGQVAVLGVAGRGRRKPLSGCRIGAETADGNSRPTEEQLPVGARRDRFPRSSTITARTPGNGVPMGTRSSTIASGRTSKATEVIVASETPYALMSRGRVPVEHQFLAVSAGNSSLPVTASRRKGAAARSGGGTPPSH